MGSVSVAIRLAAGWRVTTQLDAFLATTLEPEIRQGSYDGKLDGPRLSKLLVAVRDLMLDGTWRSLAELHAVCGHTEGGCHARLRELRQRHAGGYLVDCRQRHGAPRGVNEYRVRPPFVQLGNPYEQVQPVASPHAAKIAIEGANVPAAFTRGAR